MDTEADAGLEVVLTPLQLAAILQNDSIDESSTLANRFWGAASVIAGALEMQGAAALLLVPEPTLATKLAGGALALHGSDTSAAGWVQLVTGRTRTTLTARAVAAAARAVGADPQSAAFVGMALDMAVPTAAGFVGAARAVAIRQGAIRLAAEESAGGHALKEHVGRTEAQLRARLATQKRIRAASTFHSLEEAESTVAQALRANRSRIQSWAQLGGVKEPLLLSLPTGRIVGTGIVRGSTQLENMTRVVVVMKKSVTQNRVYFILTAYPAR